MSPRPKELFRPKIPKAEQERNFFSAYAPLVEINARVNLPGSHEEGEIWRFDGYDKERGKVIVAVRPAGQEDSRNYYVNQEIPLAEFYLANPDKSPAGMEVPLSFIIDVYDRHTNNPAEQIVDADGELSDAAFEHLKKNPRTREAALQTLVGLEEGRKMVASMYFDSLQTEGGKPQNEHGRLRELKRNELFGLEEELAAKAA